MWPQYLCFALLNGDALLNGMNADDFECGCSTDSNCQQQKKNNNDFAV